MSEAIAVAHPNIALVKYWGKRDVEYNLPAAGSLSVTLDTLETRTRVSFERNLNGDHLRLDGRGDVGGRELRRVEDFLDIMRAAAGTDAHARVETRNNFPTRAGLASSASGFAALAVAAAEALELDCSKRELSALARRGSGSAARSIFGGFVRMETGSQEEQAAVGARQLHAPEHWDLACVIGITVRGEKPTGSTDGMLHTEETSPYYDAWLDVVESDLPAAESVIDERNFGELQQIAETNCLRMHASAMAAQPGLIYWHPTTLRIIRALRRRRQAGELRKTLFTIDAGPHVKVFCPSDRKDDVAEWLSDIEGVRDVLMSGIGQGARLCSSLRSPSS